MDIICASFALVFGLLSLFTNGVSALVLYNNLALTYGSPIIYYFVTLACMYFLKGIVTICWAISVLANSPHKALFRTIGDCAYWTTALSLFLTLFAMTVERYINTVSMKQFQWLRARKTVYIYFCLIIVVFSLICGQLVALQHTGLYVEFVICIVAELAYVLTILLFIFFWLKQNARTRENARRHKVITHHNTQATRTTATRSSCRPEFQEQKRLNIIVLCYIIGTLVTVLPFFAAFQAKLVGLLIYKEYHYENLNKLLDIYSMFTCLNYGLTPLFYFFALPQFKSAVYQVLSCKQLHQSALEGSIVTQESEETTSGGDFV